MTMICGLMTACGSGGDTPSTAQQGETSKESQQSEPSKEAQTSGETEPAAATEVLKVPFLSGDVPKDPVIQELVNKFNETTGKEQGIGIEYTVTAAGELLNTLSLGLENGELPYVYYGSKGSNMAMEEGGFNIPFSLLPGGAEFVADWEAKAGSAGMWSKVTGSNEIYYLAYDNQGPALFYNKDMFVEKGIVDENGEAKPPETWDEFLKDAEILTDDEHFGLAMGLQWGSYALYHIVYNAFSMVPEGAISFDYDNLKSSFNLERPYEVIGEIYQKGYCVPGAETIDNDPARSYFSEGVAGMFLGYSWDVGVFTTQYVANFDWDLCALKNEDGTDYGIALAPAVGLVPTKKVLELSEADQEKVMTVIKWFYSDEVGARLTEEGQLSSSNPSFLEKADKSKMLPQTVKMIEIMTSGRVFAFPGKVQGLSESNTEKSLPTLLNETLLDYCKGNMTIEEVKEEIESAIDLELQTEVESGTLNPDDYK